MSKWFAIDHDGDIFCLSNCKNIDDAYKSANEVGIDIGMIIPQKQAKTWAEFIFKTLNKKEHKEEEDE